MNAQDSRDRSRRQGVTVGEVVVALLAALLLVQLSLRALASARRLAVTLVSRAEAVETVRTTRFVLRSELSEGAPTDDWTVHAPDSLKLRAFRGVARVCPGGALTDEVVVTWRGSRRPDPAKDSVLVLLQDATWVVLDLVDTRGSASCPADASIPVERWRLSETPAVAPVMLRVFERGAYHVSGRAFRYRPGGAGRQPLTAEALEVPPSGFGWDGTNVHVSLRGRVEPSWQWGGRVGGGRRP